VEIVDFATIVREFKLSAVNHSSAFFDIKKLNSFNGDYIRKLTVDQFVTACEPWLTGGRTSGAAVGESPSAPWPAERFDRSVFLRIAPHVQTRVALLSEVPSMVDFLFLPDAPIDAAAFDKAFGTEWAVPTLRAISDRISAGEWNAESLKSAVEAVGAEHDVKLGKLQAPLRVATTGRSVGPPLFESLEVLGRNETIRRIDVALTRAG